MVDIIFTFHFLWKRTPARTTAQWDNNSERAQTGWVPGRVKWLRTEQKTNRRACESFSAVQRYMLELNDAMSVCTDSPHHISLPNQGVKVSDLPMSLFYCYGWQSKDDHCYRHELPNPEKMGETIKREFMTNITTTTVDQKENTCQNDIRRNFSLTRQGGLIGYEQNRSLDSNKAFSLFFFLVFISSPLHSWCDFNFAFVLFECSCVVVCLQVVIQQKVRELVLPMTWQWSLVHCLWVLELAELVEHSMEDDYWKRQLRPERDTCKPWALAEQEEETHTQKTKKKET